MQVQWKCLLAASLWIAAAACAVNGQVSSTPVAGESAQGPVRVSAGVMASLILHKVSPVYPPDAKAAHVSGSVVMHAIISDAGAVEKLDVVSGPDSLRAAALEAVRQWTYKPYQLNGKPVRVETQITVNFFFTK